MKNINLIKARERKGLTQDELAKRLGYKGRQSIANWENGYNSTPLSTALRIAEILEEDIFFLFGDNVQDSHTTEPKEVI